MTAGFALVAMGLLILVALIMFGNELYYRKRVSALGIIVLVSTVYLMWYMHDITEQMLDLTTQQLNGKTSAILKGE
jgi:threonine/homoserine/homoserine lactone efflux protein